MSLPILREIGNALRNLNPREVQALADEPLTMGVLALDEAFCSRVFSFLVPDDLSVGRAREAGKRILRIANEEDFQRCQLGLAEAGLPHPEHFYTFDDVYPAVTIRLILDENEDLYLPLARWFAPFREPVIDRIIGKISKENALFTIATSVPNVVPSAISVPWAFGEFASDTAFLTANQVRMAFLIAAASDREVGYSDQKSQIASIIAAAFGWRALAREMVSKVPAGGGLVTKGLISFAGTYTVGKGLDKLFRLGGRMTREERKLHYAQAWERGREAVQEMAQRFTTRLSAARST